MSKSYNLARDCFRVATGRRVRYRLIDGVLTVVRGREITRRAPKLRKRLSRVKYPHDGIRDGITTEEPGKARVQDLVRFYQDQMQVNEEERQSAFTF